MILLKFLGSPSLMEENIFPSMWFIIFKASGCAHPYNYSVGALLFAFIADFDFSFLFSPPYPPHWALM